MFCMVKIKIVSWREMFGMFCIRLSFIMPLMAASACSLECASWTQKFRFWFAPFWSCTLAFWLFESCLIMFCITPVITKTWVFRFEVVFLTFPFGALFLSFNKLSFSSLKWKSVNFAVKTLNFLSSKVLFGCAENPLGVCGFLTSFFLKLEFVKLDC